MSSPKSSSKSSSSRSEHSIRKSHERSLHENHRHHRHQSSKKVNDSHQPESPHEYNVKVESHQSEDSVIRLYPREELYRLDDGAEIWRTFDGSAIIWEVHKLTFEEFSQAIWNWAESGLDQIQKSYVAYIHPPHGGHQSRLLDFFCSHRQKLIRDHIQRIYSDLYLVLRTWTELKHYLRQLDHKTIPQSNSKTLKKIENRLTFHLMVSLREYSGLPLDPKNPDKPSWPSSGNETQRSISRLKAEALASTLDSIPKASAANEKSILKNQESDSKALCCHCHQVLDPSPVNSLRTPPLSITSAQSESSVNSHPSGSRKERKARSKSTSREEDKGKTESKLADESIREEKKKKSQSKSAKESNQSHSSRPLPVEKTYKKSNVYRSRSKSREKNSDESDNMSLISFDSNQFSNTFGTMFSLL